MVNSYRPVMRGGPSDFGAPPPSPAPPSEQAQAFDYKRQLMELEEKIRQERLRQYQQAEQQRFKGGYTGGLNIAGAKSYTPPEPEMDPRLYGL